MKALARLHALLTLWPWLALLSLYALSFEARKIIGHWPVPYADDPKGIWRDFDTTLGPLLTNGLLAGLFFGIVPWIVLYFLFWRFSSPRTRCLSPLTGLLGIAALWLEPGGRFAWWMD